MPTGDVGSTYPGAGEGPKGPAVRRLKSYVSWVSETSTEPSVNKLTHNGGVHAIIK